MFNFLGVDQEFVMLTNTDKNTVLPKSSEVNRGGCVRQLLNSTAKDADKVPAIYARIHLL